jgi:hypothetical protein
MLLEQKKKIISDKKWQELVALLCHIQINSTQFAKNIKMPIKIFNLELQRDG